MAFEAYKIGIKIALVDGITAGLAGIAGHFKSLHQQVGQAQGSIGELEKSLNRIKVMGAVGFGMTGVGLAGLSLFKAPLEEAMKFDQQINKFALFGLGDKVNAEAVSFAKGMSVIGSSYTENLQHMIEAQGVFREAGLGGSSALDGAKLAAPTLAKIDFVGKSLGGDSEAKMHTQGLAMLRFIEMRGGLKDAGAFNSIANEGFKAIQSSGGNVDFEQYRQFAARAGASGQNLSNEALFGKLEPIIGELKGSTAGFALRTAYNRLNGIIKLPNQAAHELMDMGIWDKSKVELNSGGGIKSFRGNPLKDTDGFAKDPVSFYERNIMPLYAKKGLNPEQITRENAMIFGSTGGAFFNLVQRQIDNIHKSEASQKVALGIDDSVKQADKSATGQMIKLQAEWSKTLTDLGMTVLPIAIRGANLLIDVLQSATRFMREFPTLTKGLLIGFGVLAGVVTASGVLTLATSGFLTLGKVLSFAAAGGSPGIALLATRLLTFGASMATFATMLGGAAVALAAGYTVGTLAYDKLAAGTKAADRLGSLTHLFGLLHEKADPLVASQMYSGKGKGTVQVNSTLMLDGRKFAEAVTEHQTSALSKPTGGSQFDLTMSLPQPGWNYGR